MRQKLCNALSGCVAVTVYSNVPNRATRDKCIRRCSNAPLNVFPLRSLRGRCRLRQMRCYYICAVGATLLTYVSVSSAPKSIAVGNGFIRSAYTGFVGNFDTGPPEITVSVGAPIRLQKSAKRYGFHHCLEPGCRKKCIGRCVNSPLKNLDE